MSQRNFINKISPKELTKAVYLSQALFFLISIILGFVFIGDISSFLALFKLNGRDILYYGVFLAIALVIVEIILYHLLPKPYFDDGGINEKLFRHQPLSGIFLIALTVSISEEFLFRAVIQTTFGYLFASSLFVLFHTRYLKKPVLLIGIIGTSFLIGYLFEVTNNLLVTIVFHFVVDFTLGLYIKFKK